MIVRDGGEEGRALEMGIDRPEVLDGRYGRERNCGFLVVGVLRRGWAVPDHPGGLQGMFLRTGDGGSERRRPLCLQAL